MKFNKGNKVICVDTQGNWAGLKVGETYTVERGYNDGYDDFVYVEEFPNEAFYTKRFKLKVNKPAKKKKTIETIIVGEGHPKVFETAVAAKQKEGFYIAETHCSDSGYVAVMKRELTSH